MKAVRKAIEHSDKMPHETEYLLHEADQEGADADVSLPLVEMQPITSEWVNIHNDDKVGNVRDDDGNVIAEVYHSEYELGIQIDIWTAEGSEHDPDQLGASLREALYPHTSHGPSEPFIGDRGQDLDSIWYFALGDGERADDLVQTPSLRRWSQEVMLWGYEEFRSDVDYIITVNYPGADELESPPDDSMTEG